MSDLLLGQVLPRFQTSNALLTNSPLPSLRPNGKPPPLPLPGVGISQVGALKNTVLSGTEGPKVLGKGLIVTGQLSDPHPFPPTSPGHWMVYVK